MKIKNQEKLLNFLNTKIKNPCPICNEFTWNINETIFELREFNNGDMVIGGNSSILPIIPLTCSSCGNVIFINALVCGALDNKDGG